MGVIYRKIPLTVTAMFLPDGSVLPKGLIHENSSFTIDRIVSKRERSPRAVTSIAPLEYTVMVRGREKKIYYEPESNMWFSVKEIHT